jgi:hypothetical protein
MKQIKTKAGAFFVFVMVLSAFAFQSGCLYLKNHPGGIFPQAKETGSLEYEEVGEAEGTSSEFILMWVARVTPEISFDDAVTEAIRNKGGDNLINITSWREKNVYMVGTVNVIHVKGTVIRYIR